MFLCQLSTCFARKPRTIYASVLTDVHQDNIRPDLLDIPERNAVIFLAFEEILPFAPSGHIDLVDTAAAFVKLQIPDSAKLFAVS